MVNTNHLNRLEVQHGTLLACVKSSGQLLILDSGQDESCKDLCEGNLELLTFRSGADWLEVQKGRSK